MKVVIKTPDGRYVGGGRIPDLVIRISRAYVYDDEIDRVDEQISIVNTMYGYGWRKVPAGSKNHISDP